MYLLFPTANIVPFSEYSNSVQVDLPKLNLGTQIPKEPVFLGQTKLLLNHTSFTDLEPYSIYFEVSNLILLISLD